MNDFSSIDINSDDFFIQEIEVPSAVIQQGNTVGGGGGSS